MFSGQGLQQLSPDRPESGKSAAADRNAEQHVPKSLSTVSYEDPGDAHVHVCLKRVLLHFADFTVLHVLMVYGVSLYITACPCVSLYVTVHRTLLYVGMCSGSRCSQTVGASPQPSASSSFLHRTAGGVHASHVPYAEIPVSCVMLC